MDYQKTTWAYQLKLNNNTARFLTDIGSNKAWIRRWISSYILVKQFDIITHPCPNFNDSLVNTLRSRQDGRYFADDIFKCIFFNENGCILINFSLKYVRKGSIDNNPPLVQIMAWRRSGAKSLSEPMMIILPTHICVTRPQWVKKTMKRQIHVCFCWMHSIAYI